MSVAPSFAPSELSLLCPACGYDLRGITSDRCPECGEDVAALSDQTSTIPWTNRRERGRVRTWFATVWRFTRRTRWLSTEIARPVLIRDARRFWLVTATLLSLLPITLFVLAWREAGDLQFAVSPFMPERSIFTPGTSGWAFYDLALPWASGALIPGLLPLMMWLATLLCTGACTYVFHPRGLHPQTAARAVALAYYRVGTLVLPTALLATVLTLARLSNATRGGDWEWIADQFGRRATFGVDILTALFVVAIGLSVAWACVTFVIALRCTTRCGWLYVLFASAALPAIWAACLAFTLGFLPWAIGYLWMTIDGFRE